MSRENDGEKVEEKKGSPTDTKGSQRLSGRSSATSSISKNSGINIRSSGGLILVESSNFEPPDSSSSNQYHIKVNNFESKNNNATPTTITPSPSEKESNAWKHNSALDLRESGTQKNHPEVEKKDSKRPQLHMSAPPGSLSNYAEAKKKEKLIVGSSFRVQASLDTQDEELERFREKYRFNDRHPVEHDGNLLGKKFTISKTKTRIKQEKEEEKERKRKEKDIEKKRKNQAMQQMRSMSQNEVVTPF
ncbi:hypothetical protein PROFUN_01551 [Planoprotostelium fungivorum]|uniref:Uncharacterized protein n=1 Tax=Planoprotostelium fungivorum TaxID=1890364 RepID=A0A2P6NTI5_9EUKA|nr:hypothetical protein PROFUN_01551 [Planoprotostelium fungivorum]